MKKIPIIVLAGILCVSTANANTVKALVQPFIQSYALDDHIYRWFTDIDLTDPTGSYFGVGEEIDRLHQTFPGFQFSPTSYTGLNEFEFGYSAPRIIKLFIVI